MNKKDIQIIKDLLSLAEARLASSWSPERANTVSNLKIALASAEGLKGAPVGGGK